LAAAATSARIWYRGCRSRVRRHNVSRGQREPYQPHAAWKSVRQVTIDREKAEKAGEFGPRVRAWNPIS